MISSIINDFRNSVIFCKANEIALFRALAASIVSHSSSTFIDETHGGNVCNVSFAAATGKTETCEIADLLIISSAPNHSRLRATFWQAKKQHASKWLNVTHTGSQLDFRGQFNQWDLLSRRPAISGVASFAPPIDLLSSFGSPSIGSFGIFYEKGSTIEVAHSIAEFISCPSPSARYPTLSINGYLDKYQLSDADVITRMNLCDFLSALFAFRIGALLDPSYPSHRWLVSWARAKVAAGGVAPSLRVLDNFLGNERAMEIVSAATPGGPSVLVVGPLNH